MVSAVVPTEEALTRLEGLAYGRDRCLRVHISPSGTMPGLTREFGRRLSLACDLAVGPAAGLPKLGRLA